MSRWTDFIKEYVKHHGGSYKEALSNPEVKQEYWKIYPKHSPEGKEYTKVKEQAINYQDQAVKFQRDETQKDLAEIANQQKVKDKSIQYRRDEAQKELSGIAQFQKLTDKRKQYQDQKEHERKIRYDYSNIVPLLYDYTHQYKLIQDNTTKYTQLKPQLKTLKQSLNTLTQKLKAGTSKSLRKFISIDEFNEIEKTPLENVGIQPTGRPSKRIVEIIDTLIKNTNNLIEITPTL